MWIILIAERIAYVKSQVVENLAEDKSDENSSSTNSQNDINYINQAIGEPIHSVKDEKDTYLTQDSQEDFDFIDGVDVPIEFIEGKVDNSIEYYIWTWKRDFQSIDKCVMVKSQDVPIEVANEQEIEACMQEEVVSDMILPDVYRVDTEIHTDVQLEIPIIKSEEKCVTQSEPKLVQDVALLHDTPIPLQTIAQPMTEQKVLLPDRALQGKLIPIPHASWRETLRSESVRKKLQYIQAQYADPLLNHLISKIV